MNVIICRPPMTRAAFFAWAQAQDADDEFDGAQPVIVAAG